MEALVFRYSLARLAAAKILGALHPGAYAGAWSPFRLEKVPEPELPADDWVVVKNVPTGICEVLWPSDHKGLLATLEVGR
ncbi:MAG: hypothetical protein HYZ28_25935 [Myxococcales bacterium]|nr:hypothetical protein [Myxococcales bacterium]